MTKLQAIRKFAEEVIGEHVTILNHDDNNWSMVTNSMRPRMYIPADRGVTKDEGDKLFRANIVEHCSMARGFSDATLSILHECGHWANREVHDGIAYEKMMKEATEEEYFRTPFEMLATMWTICWLQSKENRRLAKRFEREYFGY